MAHHTSEHGAHEEHHVTPISVYVQVIAVLMFLTVLTVITAQFDFGPLNALVAMAIAGTKAVLVLLFFMGLKYDTKLNVAVFSSSIIALALLIGFASIDVFSRKNQFIFKERLEIKGK